MLQIAFSGALTPANIPFLTPCRKGKDAAYWNKELEEFIFPYKNLQQ